VICLLGGSECLFTSLDLDRVCSDVMTANSPSLVGTSDDAGRLFNFFKLHVLNIMSIFNFFYLAKIQDSRFSILHYLYH
jgi:hypothetical protein